MMIKLLQKINVELGLHSSYRGQYKAKVEFLLKIVLAMTLAPPYYQLM